MCLPHFQLQNEVLHAMIGKCYVQGHFEGQPLNGHGGKTASWIVPKI